ncbi:MAG: L,D-transpeptidase [Candidatus Absconditabacterales bacterium]
MDYKRFLLAGALLLQSPEGSHHKNETADNLYTTLQSQEEITSPYCDFEISQKNLQEISTMSLDVNCPVVFSRSWEDMKETPFVKLHINKHIGGYLGYDQYNNILKKYNNDTIPNSLKKSGDLGIDKFEHIRFPLIYDELDTLVSHTLEGLLQDERFAKYRDTIKVDDTMIIVMKQKNGQHALLYYKKGKLTLATYATIGRGKSTSRGLFRVDYRVTNKRSKKYKNAAMPYALHVVNNVFIHQGKVSSTQKSHGCCRIPGLYAEVLSYLVTAPTIDMVYSSQHHKLDIIKTQLCDSLTANAPQVLIVD